MEKTFSVKFHLKQTKNKRAELPVYLRITADGISTELCLKRTWQINKWHATLGRAEGRSENARSLNAFLEVIQRKVYDARTVLIENNQPVTAVNLKLLITGQQLPGGRRTLLEVFQRHNDQIKALKGREYAAGTIERYETAYRHTAAYMKWKYQIEDIELEKLDYEFINDYEFWLKSIRKCDHNSTMKYLSNFKKIVLLSLRAGWLRKDPFIGFKMTRREVERIALTQVEIERIIEKTFNSTRLTLVRDIFIFSCYTGLSYADVEKFKTTEIMPGIDGENWIYCKRQKTDVPSRIPLLGAAQKIVDKYAAHDDPLREGYVFPVFSNQKMNAYLKEIADLCAISKKLTFHIARHTFATTITLSNGVPMETVSKMLGHKNLKTTQHYAKILDGKISQDMRPLKNRFA